MATVWLPGASSSHVLSSVGSESAFATLHTRFWLSISTFRAEALPVATCTKSASSTFTPHTSDVELRTAEFATTRRNVRAVPPTVMDLLPPDESDSVLYVPYATGSVSSKVSFAVSAQKCLDRPNDPLGTAR